MKRTEFIKTCGYSCLGLAGATLLLPSCSGINYLEAEIVDDFLIVGLNAFYDETNQDQLIANHVVVQNPKLGFPVAVFRITETEYRAILMRCTHQGTELRLYGDRFECPAHGSEFSSKGLVESGPADENLMSLAVQKETDHLKIDLR